MAYLNNLAHTCLCIPSLPLAEAFYAYFRFNNCIHPVEFWKLYSKIGLFLISFLLAGLMWYICGVMSCNESLWPECRSSPWEFHGVTNQIRLLMCLVLYCLQRRVIVTYTTIPRISCHWLCYRGNSGS